MCEQRNPNSNKNILTPSELLNWSIEQYRHLTEERRVFDRYMWQLPSASLVIIALLLNSVRIFSQITSVGPILVRLILLISSGISCYSAFMLGRLHARRNLREAKIKELEKNVSEFSGSYPYFSSMTSSDIVSKKAKKSKSLINRWFARINTSTLGISVLLIVTILLIIAAVLV